MNSDILSNLDACNRKGKWGAEWEPIRLKPTEMMYRAIRAALTSEREDSGELAGEEVMSLAATRGVDARTHHLYDCALHHASLADILTSYLRPAGSPPWRVPPAIEGVWEPKCHLSPSGDSLCRIILVRDWDEQRMAGEARSWRTMGEMAIYELPMTLYVMVLGASRNEKRYSAWTQGYIHPFSRQLRFQKKHRTSSNPYADQGKRTSGEHFGETWETVFREDRPEISREKWLEAMKADGMFKQLAIKEVVGLPSADKLRAIGADIETAKREFEKMNGKLPRKRYSGCHWPVECPFIHCCWGQVETEPDEKNFVRVAHSHF